MDKPVVSTSRGIIWQINRILFFAVLLVGFLALGVSVASSASPSNEASQARLMQSSGVLSYDQPAMSKNYRGYRGIPTISIVSVEKGVSVTFMTHNYPPNQEFTVLMGAMYTRGINGVEVGTFNSDDGGSFEKTFDIPDEFKDAERVAIRAQTAHKHPYYSFNWFKNQDEAAHDDDKDDDDTTQHDDDDDGHTAVYKGFPTFKICDVEQNKSVTIATSNLPPNQTFEVRMGAFGKRGLHGVKAGSFESGEGGALNVTIEIPAELHGRYRISIRAQTAHKHPYYAFNWFYNNDASVCK